MSANSVLVEKDVNAAAQVQSAGAKPDIKSMEYHRQVLQGKLAGGECVFSFSTCGVQLVCEPGLIQWLTFFRQ